MANPPRPGNSSRPVSDGDPFVTPKPFLRTAKDQDSAGVIQLIGGIFEEYENCILDVEKEEQKLLTPASSYDRFWVVEDLDSIVGCIACGSYPRPPAESNSIDSQSETYFELQKLYVDSSQRGQGWGRRLADVVEQEARRLGYQEIELWTDTRFETAHKVYEILGYRRTGRSRDLHDLSQTVEYHFIKSLCPS